MLTPAYQVPDVTSGWLAHELALPEADTFINQVLRLDATTLVVDEKLLAQPQDQVRGLSAPPVLTPALLCDPAQLHLIVLDGT